MRINAMEEKNFKEVELFGKPALFTCLRVERSSVPKGLYLYELRHDDDGQGIACQIAKGILVNHWGSVITRNPVKLPPDGYLDMNDEDINYSTGDCRTVKEYMEKYPFVKRREEYER